jgi:WD40 repeat protein
LELHGLPTAASTRTPEFNGIPSRLSPFSAPQAADLAEYFPQFEILDLLGQGGMGAVYKARQIKLDRFVALKVLPPAAGTAPAFAERFAREARALAQLNHPNIVTVHDFGQAGKLWYFVMEYVDGPNLRRVLQGGRVQPQEAFRIVLQICDGLQFAHGEGIVHRDVKPENILLDKRGRVKIADFGIAKILGHDTGAYTLTAPGQVVGTLHYMAPEQLDNPLNVDHRADIYSLGVVFYEMLTGQLPLGRFVPPSQKAPVDVRLDQVIVRALEYGPERRYQHVSEVRTDVEAITAGKLQLASMTFPGAAVPAQPLEHRPIMPPIGTSTQGGLGESHGLPRGIEPAVTLERAMNTPCDDMAGPPAAPTASTLRFRKRSTIVGAMAAGMLAVIGLAYLGQTLTVRTPNGILEITTEDPEIEVIVQNAGQRVAILDLRTKHKFELKEGMYQLALSPQKKGLVLEPNYVTLRRDQKAIARVRWMQTPHEVAKAPRSAIVPAGHSEKWAYRNNHGNGCFINSGGTDWFEVHPDGAISYFKEAERNYEYVEIYDASRQCWVRLYSNKSLWNGPTFTKREWNMLCTGSWTSVAGRIRHFGGGDAKIGTATFAPDGRSVLASDAAGRIWTWEDSNGAELHLFRVHGGGGVYCVAFSPDGRRAASCGYDKLVRVWDINKREEVVQLRGHSERVLGVAFSPDGKHLVTSAGDRLFRADCTVRVWDTRTWDQLQCMREHTDEVWDVAFSPDGKLIASASDDRTVRLWDAKTGTHLDRLLRTQAKVSALCFSPDGKQLAAGGQERSVWLWEVEGRKQIRQISDLPGWITRLAYSPDGRLLLVRAGSQVLIWDIGSGNELSRFPDDSVQDSGPSPGALAVSPDGRQVLLSSGHGKGLYLWEVPALLSKGGTGR